MQKDCSSSPWAVQEVMQSCAQSRTWWENDAQLWDVIADQVHAVETIAEICIVEMNKAMSWDGKKDFAEDPLEGMPNLHGG